MTILHVIVETGTWCPSCCQWMGWEEGLGRTDIFLSNDVHLNCEAPYTRPAEPCVDLPRVAIFRDGQYYE